MKDSEEVGAAAAGELAPDAPRPSDDSASGGIHDVTNMRAINLERARRLGRRLRVEVTVDETGWLRCDVEVFFTKEPDGTIRPVKVRVGCEASDEGVLAHGGVVARCAEYNGAISKLRQLGERLVTMVHEGRITLTPGSPVEYAHRELSGVDELIAGRQAVCMGHGVIRLQWLVLETEYFGRCDAHFAAILLAAECAARTNDPRAASPPRWARLWLRR